MVASDAQIAVLIQHFSIGHEPETEGYQKLANFIRAPDADQRLILLDQFLRAYGHADSFRHPGEAPLNVGQIFNRDPNAWKLLQLGLYLQSNLKIDIVTAGDLLRRIRVAKVTNTPMPRRAQVVQARLIPMPVMQALEVAASGMTTNLAPDHPGAATWSFRLRPMQLPNENKAFFIATAHYKWAPDAYAFNGMTFGYVELECSVGTEQRAVSVQPGLFDNAGANKLMLVCTFRDELGWAMRESRRLARNSWGDIMSFLNRVSILDNIVQDGRIIESGVLPGRGFLDYTETTQTWPADDE